MLQCNIEITLKQQNLLKILRTQNRNQNKSTNSGKNKCETYLKSQQDVKSGHRVFPFFLL